MKFALVFAATIMAVSAAGFDQYGRYKPAAPSKPAAVASRVSSSDQAANVLRYDNVINPDGSYSYALETDNGIAAAAQGTPRDFGGNPPIVPVVSQGSFSWTSPEGQPIVISYVADENGYQPTGDAIPTAPAIPEAILRSLEYLSKVQKK
ncbi:hypothetical protein SFRURICE_020387 [Spodoptera frugiperda]|uniref:Larval cuticle protein LCP-22-like isoform X1 n=1 Tax=Spodoptera frugiperda TaxID=7108 RepID=A0A2H1W7V3_SPOFR|nr:larval cuticle protein LCP-22-like isoform X1 [Spodoptera frugiperda]XP_035459281.1 larval cuticle protein LCP-22-like isoform X2 [Spodoptera frugiperda]XP_050557252.1 larval cuticle protein LCP-22-like isoform X2 [Spodoptera frugiperda]XP_050557253.1 larval cuticle protein LCP-22-like isoform X3 [Spodoptera frugiperda]KAF9798822.1 hypothetical protein SFRURICE_020386 [Spodoptera frugiperda]KAF9798823.1 hypothetical protein SFRURICE_020387 [Spodoptera frugiperda]